MYNQSPNFICSTNSTYTLPELDLRSGACRSYVVEKMFSKEITEGWGAEGQSLDNSLNHFDLIHKLRKSRAHNFLPIPEIQNFHTNAISFVAVSSENSEYSQSKWIPNKNNENSKIL